MSAPLFPWDNNNSSGAIGAPTAIGGVPTVPPLKLGAPISGAASGNNSGALTPHPIMASSGHPIPRGAPPVAIGRPPNNAAALVGHSGQQVRPQHGSSAAGVGGAVAASNTAPHANAAAAVTNAGNPAGAMPMAHMPYGGSGGMMGPSYGSSSMMGMSGGLMGAYGGGMMSGAYGSGMMMGGGMMGGASHAMMGQAGAAGAAAAVGPDGRPIAPVAKLQGWAIFAELASRLVQVIMHMARSGHEVFSVVAGSYWAFTSIRAMLGLGGASPMHPLIQQQQQALAMKNGATPAAAAAMVGLSSKTTANAAAASATTTTTATNAAAAAAPAGSSGRRTALLFGLFMVVATIMEFLYRRHQEKKKQQELEALQRKLLLSHSSSNAPAASTAAAVSDATAQAAGAGSSSTRCVAIHDFAGDGDGQLAFRCGDQLEVKEFDPNGWCFAASTGIAREDPAAARGVDEASTNPAVSGWVPGNFLRPLLQHRKL